MCVTCFGTACPMPSTPVNATLNATTGTPGIFGSTMTFGCHAGHKFSDMAKAKTIECVVGNTWNDTLSACAGQSAIQSQWDSQKCEWWPQLFSFSFFLPSIWPSLFSPFFLFSCSCFFFPPVKSNTLKIQLRNSRERRKQSQRVLGRSQAKIEFAAIYVENMKFSGTDFNCFPANQLTKFSAD